MRKALMVWGGWDGHTPKEATEVIAPLLRDKGFEVEVSDSMTSYDDAEALASYDLIVQCVTMSSITGDQFNNLRQAVRSGTGFAGWHGGIIDSFRENTEYQWMTGGQWVAHPGGLISSYTVDVIDTDHEITSGVSSFVLENTEQYYMHVDPGCHVLCSTVFSGEYGEPDLYPAGTVMPYAWTRSYGKGRVFVACWGHTHADFVVDEARELVVRGLAWAAKPSS